MTACFAALLLRRDRGARGRARVPDLGLRAHARAAQDPDHAGADHAAAASRCGCCARSCCSRACSAATSGPGCSAGCSTPASRSCCVRHLRYFIEPVWAWVAFVQPFGIYGGVRDGRGSRRPLGASFPRRARPLHLDAVGPPDARAAARDRRLPGLAMKYVAHTDIVAVKAFILGLMLLRLAAAARRRARLRAPRAGRAADADLPVQQVAARARRLLLADAQPGRRSARASPPRRVGGPTRPRVLKNVMAADVKAPPLREFPGTPPPLAPDAMAASKPYVATRQDAAGARLPRRARRRLAADARSTRWASCSASTARSRCTSTRASTAARAPTSATTSSAPAIRSTCRSRART